MMNFSMIFSALVLGDVFISTHIEASEDSRTVNGKS